MVVMNKLKIFLYTYRDAFFNALMLIGIFIAMIIAHACVPSVLIRIRLYNMLTFFLYFLSFTSLPYIYYKMYDKKLLCLLPVSRSTKFLMPLGVWGLGVILTYLLTIPIEAVAHVFTISNAPEQQIVIGGFLRYGFNHNAIVFISLVFASLFVFVRSLVRNEIALLSILGGIFFVIIMPYISYMMDFVMFPPAMSTNAIIGCLAVSALLIAASYQLFKHWQPANDGIFRI